MMGCDVGPRYEVELSSASPSGRWRGHLPQQVGEDFVPAAAGWPDDPERACRVARTQVADGMAALAAHRLSLTGE